MKYLESILESNKREADINWSGGYDKIDDDIRKALAAGHGIKQIAFSLGREYEGWDSRKAQTRIFHIMKIDKVDESTDFNISL